MWSAPSRKLRRFDLMPTAHRAPTKFGPFVIEQRAWLEATEAWQAIRTLSRAARSYVAQMKRSGAVRFRQF